MSAPTIELLRWIDARERTYDETIEAWKSSCPRLSVWDDAVIGGLVRVRSQSAGNGRIVTVTALGRALLDGRGPR